MSFSAVALDDFRFHRLSYKVKFRNVTVLGKSVFYIFGGFLFAFAERRAVLARVLSASDKSVQLLRHSDVVKNSGLLGGPYFHNRDFSRTGAKAQTNDYGKKYQ